MQELYKTSSGRLAWFTPGQEPKGATKVGKKPKAEKKSETAKGTDDVDILAKAQKQVKNKSAKAENK